MSKTKAPTAIRYERVPIASLVRDSANPRSIAPKSKGRLRASIKRFGLVQPVVVSERDGKRLVIGGHQRLDALEAEGAREVDVAIGSWSPADERALNVTLNNPANQGEFSGGLETYLDSVAGGLNALDFLSLGLAELLPSADNDASGYQDRMAEVEELDTGAINGARFEIRLGVFTFLGSSSLWGRIVRSNPLGKATVPRLFSARDLSGALPSDSTLPDN